MDKPSIKALPTEAIRSNRWLAVGAAPDEVEGWKEVFLRHGPVMPMVVRPAADGGYVVVAGERELEAVRALKTSTTEAVVVPLNDACEAHKLTLKLLSLREASHHLEQALILKEILKDPNVSQRDMATLCGRSVSWVSKRLRLVESLKPAVIDLVARRVLSPATAQQIAKLPPAKQQRFAVRVVDEGLPKSAVEKLVALFNAPHTSQELRREIIASPRDVMARIKRGADQLARPLNHGEGEDRRLHEAIRLLERLFNQIKVLLAEKPPADARLITRIQRVAEGFLTDIIHPAQSPDLPRGKQRA